MLIAQTSGSEIVVIADHQVIFPNVSFSTQGPDASFLEEHGCLPVIEFLPHNPEVETLEPTTPYFGAGSVYTVIVRPLTSEEQTAKAAAARASMVVSPLQAKAELMVRNLYDAVDGIVEASNDPLMKLAWNNALEFRRTSPLVLGLASIMGWSDSYLDDIFVKAAKREF